ncbi:polysaccharide deacetylase family protein [Janthinobacterium sp. 17J80-10]|uniref:DUF2334 domain-containing protein n=1 Tax=Janthinobacterium sp. 17J80-10 TaxID=2497863 RepID=UPI0010053B60|nr:polysaccharide deacetylase family protein [Janthinobacterium sp. 17J80-10]QAU34541.1 DUF2334 domain-containing protein [Janthinobacterium sp. 17J80-10]
MVPSDMKSLCVSIHDVAPANWTECQRLLETVRSVADIPLTLLVIPRYHGRQGSPAGYERMLEKLLSQGHELALHGYTHLDTLPVRGSLYSRMLRTIYTQREGEFAALDPAEARQRIAMGLAWFRQRQWPVQGFIAPAWLIGAGTWSVLSEFPFEYTTTLGRFYLLPRTNFSNGRDWIASPSLVYTARNAVGRLLSPQWINLLSLFLRNSPLVRLSLHPRDAHDPALLRHTRKLLKQLLLDRDAVTKATFAHQWRIGQEAKVITLGKPSQTSP